jgi:hypothetical protein
MDVALWAVSDAACVALGALLLPRSLLGASVEQEPVAFLEVAAFALAALRPACFFVLQPGNSGTSERDAALRFLAAALWHLALGAAAAHLALVLFGAPLIDLARRTALAAALISALALGPAACSSRARASPLAAPDTLVAVVVRGEGTTAADVVLVAQARGVLLGTWLGALPIPLDWDRPWQAWPVTLYYGALAGYAAGSLVGLAQARHVKERKAKRG